MAWKKTAEQERQRSELLKQKAQELAIKADIDELKNLLGNYGQHAPRVLKFMKRLIATRGKAQSDDEFEEAGRGQANSSGTPAAKRKYGGMLALVDGSPTDSGDVFSAPDGGGRSSLQRPIDDRYSCLQDLPVRDLKEILVSLEKISLSPFAIRALAKRGAKQASQSSMAEVIEFCCGVAINATLDKAFFESLASLIDILQKLNIRRGRRAQELALPPNWETDGVYLMVDLAGGGDGIKNRFSDKIVPWPNSMVDYDGATVLDNFSEERAALSNGIQRQVLVELFRDGSAAQPLSLNALRLSAADGAHSMAGLKRARSELSASASGRSEPSVSTHGLGTASVLLGQASGAGGAEGEDVGGSCLRDSVAVGGATMPAAADCQVAAVVDEAAAGSADEGDGAEQELGTTMSGQEVAQAEAAVGGDDAGKRIGQGAQGPSERCFVPPPPAA